MSKGEATLYRPNPYHKRIIVPKQVLLLLEVKQINTLRQTNVNLHKAVYVGKYTYLCKFTLPCIFMYMNSNRPNPYTPGAGHPPKYLAGRHIEIKQFGELLAQDVVMENLVITGLRGIGKTVLLNYLRPIANNQGWAWVGEDCSEQVSVNEETLVVRLLTDIALLTSNIYVTVPQQKLGFAAPEEKQVFLNYDYLINYYQKSPGLVADKLKRVFEHLWESIKSIKGLNGIVFAYDEAQNLSDQSEDRQYPLSLLLDVFQYLQRNQVPFLLVLTGLPPLMTKLVEARTYSERLFRVLVLTRLSKEETVEAIVKPLEKQQEIEKFDKKTVDTIVDSSGGYPYFIQFICKETYDVFLQQKKSGLALRIPIETIMQKLDNSFFLARWQRATERERLILNLIAQYAEQEFGLNEISELTGKYLDKKIMPSQVLRHFKKLTSDGLIYKTRRGNYAFAVPLLESYIKRNYPTK